MNSFQTLLQFLICILDWSFLFSNEVETTDPWWGVRPQPYFGNTPINVSLISGQTAFLPCRVHMLGDRSVTWMRGRDLHILTVGHITYSADERFKVLHSEATDDWTLHIKYSQARDTGAYKCQVNSDPKIVRTLYLSITDKRLLDGKLYKNPSLNIDGQFSTSIPGPPERYLQAGSSLSLDCIIRHTKSAPTAVLWYHNNSILDYDSPRGGVSLQLEKSDDQTTSRLLLSSVSNSDSGNYSCVPVKAPRAMVYVQVNTDELRAAVHQGGVSSSSSLATISNSLSNFTYISATLSKSLAMASLIYYISFQPILRGYISLPQQNSVFN